MSAHHPSQVGIVQPCEAFYHGDLEEEEEEGEIELELGEAAAVQISGHRAQNCFFFLSESLRFYWERISLLDLLMR